MKFIIALDLGGTKLRIAKVYQDGHVKDIHEEKVKLKDGPQGLLEQILKLINDQTKNITKNELLGVGVGTAGPVDPIKGILLDPTNLHNGNNSWGTVHVKEFLENKTNLLVKVENDAAVAAISEKNFGLGINCSNIVVITLGTGLGVGVYVNNQLQRSGRFLHPEGGHLFLNADDKNAPCGCGNYGCAEAYLSGVNHVNRVKKLFGLNFKSGHEYLNLCLEGDQNFLKTLDEYTLRMSQFLTMMVVLYSPEKIIFGGGFSRVLDLIENDVSSKLEKLIKRRRVGIDLLPKIYKSELGDDQGLKGIINLFD